MGITKKKKKRKAIWFSWVRKEEKSDATVELAEGLGYLMLVWSPFSASWSLSVKRLTCLTEQWQSKAKNNIWQTISKHIILILVPAGRCDYDTGVGLPACLWHSLCPGKMRPQTYHPDTCFECFFLWWGRISAKPPTFLPGLPLHQWNVLSWLQDELNPY